jgi:hypothetical protein
MKNFDKNPPMKSTSLLHPWLKFFAVLLLCIHSSLSFGQIAAWQLFGAAGNEASINASTLDANLNTATLIRNGGVNATALVNTFSSTNYTAAGTRTDAVTNNLGMSFTLSAQSGYQVSLSTLDVRFRRSGTGPNAFVWRYSTDGINFTDIGSDISFTSTITGGVAQTQINLAGISALQNVPSGTTITIRLNGWGASATGGTFAIGRSLTSGATDYSLAIGGSVNLISGSTPTQLAITSITPSSPTVGSGFDVTVQSQDGSNIPSNVVTTTGISLSNTGGGSIGGTTTGSIVAGTNSILISGVTLSSAGTGVTLTATRTSGDILTDGTSAAFDVLAAADHLAFSGFPASGLSNTNISSFTVQALRPDLTVDNTYTGTVTLTKVSGAGNLAGTVSTACVAGVATFNAVQFDAGGTYVLEANSGSLTLATSSSISITGSASITEDILPQYAINGTTTGNVYNMCVV